MRKYAKIVFLFISDLILGLLSICLAAWIKFDFSASEAIGYIIGSYLICCGVILTALALCTLFGCYSSIWSRTGFVDLIRLAAAHGGAALIWAILKFTGVITFSGSILLIYVFLFYLLATFARVLTRLGGMTKANALRRRAVIVGCGKSGSTLAQYLVMNPESGLLPVAFVDNNRSLLGTTVTGIKVAGSGADLRTVVEKYNAQAVIIALPSASQAVTKRVFDAVKDLDVEVSFYRGVQDVKSERVAARNAIESINIEDLLGRTPIDLDRSAAHDMLSGATVLVTGGAGSIGSELCRQILSLDAAKLVIFDIFENGLFDIGNELGESFGSERFVTVVGSIRDRERLRTVFEKYKPDYVFHAAAHKHVPMMEINPIEAVKNNIFGTKNVLEQCIESKVKRCLLISSDKAVNSSNIMGATKHFAELLFMEYNKAGVTEMCAVRFGNVLGSSGSVVPFFKKQIEKGGPITLTHPDIQRYFMTIPEAVSLVLQAGSLAKGGEIFVLDMGQPVRIYDLAADMIRLAGLRVGEDIEIKVTGLRPGEKLFEELSLSDESVDKTEYEKIFVCHDQGYDPAALYNALGELRAEVDGNDEAAIEKTIFTLLPSRYRDGAKSE